MTMSFDSWIVVTGAASFINFFIIHVIVLRFASGDHVLKALMLSIWLAFVGHLIFIFLYLMNNDYLVPQLGIRGDIIWAVLSLLIYFLSVFFYVLCVFGPTETSVRFRIIEELGMEKKRGLGLRELLNRYNAREILNLRINRLQKAGDIECRDGKYFLIKKENVFFFIDILALKLKRLITPTLYGK